MRRSLLGLAALVAVLPVAGAGPARAGETVTQGGITATVIAMTAEIESTDGAVAQIGLKGREFRLNSDVLFDFDRWNLKPRAVKEISRIAVQLKAQAGGADPVRTVAVTGYTDSKGSDAYNLKLSQRRAESVRALLQQRLGAGISVTAAGRGETHPIADNTTDKGRQQNRRVEITAND